ncbi:hypothetical protein DFH09DRAFT_1206077 [Mycena vulgaris]|nr:hypothetical protein DFH09DRAFT_1206077 [Mycena vulgaris]
MEAGTPGQRPGYTVTSGGRSSDPREPDWVVGLRLKPTRYIHCAKGSSTPPSIRFTDARIYRGRAGTHLSIPSSPSRSRREQSTPKDKWTSPSALLLAAARYAHRHPFTDLILRVPQAQRTRAPVLERQRRRLEFWTPVWYLGRMTAVKGYLWCAFYRELRTSPYPCAQSDVPGPRPCFSHDQSAPPFLKTNAPGISMGSIETHGDVSGSGRGVQLSHGVHRGVVYPPSTLGLFVVFISCAGSIASRGTSEYCCTVCL